MRNYVVELAYSHGKCGGIMEHLKKNENTEKKQTLDSDPKKEENKSKNIKNKTADDPGKDILEALKKKKVINLAAEEEAETEEAVEEEQKKKGKQAEEVIKYPRYYATDLLICFILSLRFFSSF